jgi:transposase
MGRMKKEHKTIVEWKLTLEYKCPVTGKIVNKEIGQHDISSCESECDLCGSHGDITISMFKCPSCGKYHDDLEIDSW